MKRIYNRINPDETQRSGLLTPKGAYCTLLSTLVISFVISLGTLLLSTLGALFYSTLGTLFNPDEHKLDIQ